MTQHRRNMNTNLAVYAMAEEQVKYKTFMDCLQFWQFCELLHQRGITDKDSRNHQLALKIPSIALLGLMRIRHGMSLELLAENFEYSNRTRLCDYVWMVRCVLIDEHLPTLRVWTTDAYSQQRANEIYESIMEEAPPLFQMLAQNMSDPRPGSNRRCAIILVDR